MANDGGNGSNGSSEQLREEIRQTRADLGETVQALAAKADVKARVKQSAAQTADRVKVQASHAAVEARDAARRSPVPWFAIAGAAALLAVLVVLRGRRR